MIASRFAVPTAILLSLALVPTAIHGYFGYVVDDGRKADGAAAELAGLWSRPTDRVDRWMEKKFAASDWAERWYGPDEKLRLSVVRSYDPKRLYHHPELALSYGDMTIGRTESTTLPGRGEVPVTAVRSENGRPGLALYVIHYGDRFVEEPLLFQARQAVELLFSGRKPMTLIYVQDVAAPADVALGESRAMQLLTAAIESWQPRSGGTRPVSGSAGL